MTVHFTEIDVKIDTRLHRLYKLCPYAVLGSLQPYPTAG
jgi:hypothetical protein